VFWAAVAAAAAGVGVGPGAPVFLVEELDEDAFLFGTTRCAAEQCDDGVLLGAVEDAVDEDGEVSAEQREVDAEFAEGCGFSRLGHGRWDLVAGDGGGFEGFALVGVFAGGGDRVDEGVAVGDDQAADDPCRDVVLGQIVFLLIHGQRLNSLFRDGKLNGRAASLSGVIVSEVEKFLRVGSGETQLCSRTSQAIAAIPASRTPLSSRTERRCNF
jgi:hypothetical protein